MVSAWYTCIVMTDELRLRRIRNRVRELGEIDSECMVFGSTRHDWVLDDPLTAEAVDAFEGRAGIELPDEYRDYLEHVSGGGAGPYYGLEELPDEESLAELDIGAPFVGDGLDESIARSPDLRGGYLPLADQGCGYTSVLVLEGPRRGQVLADMREAHEGFVSEAPSFLAWLEGWLERALAEWAEHSLPTVLELDEELPLAAEIERLLERRAQPGAIQPNDLYPSSQVDRLEALLWLRAYQRRFDEALELVTQVFEIDERDRDARRELALARIAGARGEQQERLAAAARGLECVAWFATTTELLRERERALLELDRREEAIATMLERAEHSGHLHAYYDAAWFLIEDGEHQAAVGVLVKAVENGAAGEDDEPLAARVAACSEGLIGALEANGMHADVDRVRELIAALG
jgi:tetratricopeptide (TPR) repeat protein